MPWRPGSSSPGTVKNLCWSEMLNSGCVVVTPLFAVRTSEAEPTMSLVDLSRCE